MNNNVPVRVIDARNLFAATLNSFSSRWKPANATQITSKIIVNFIRHKPTPTGDDERDARRQEERLCPAGRPSSERLEVDRAANSHIRRSQQRHASVARLRRRQTRWRPHATAEDIAAYRNRSAHDRRCKLALPSRSIATATYRFARSITAKTAELISLPIRCSPPSPLPGKAETILSPASTQRPSRRSVKVNPGRGDFEYE